MSAFGDTSGFIALLVEADPNHAAAGTAWQVLLDRGQKVTTTSYVVVETMALLHRRFGMTGVRRFTSDIMPALLILHVGPPAFNSSLEQHLQSSREGPSFVDCISFEVMSERGIVDALAFDSHFTQRGFRLPT